MSRSIRRGMTAFVVAAAVAGGLGACGDGTGSTAAGANGSSQGNSATEGSGSGATSAPGTTTPAPASSAPRPTTPSPTATQTPKPKPKPTKSTTPEPSSTKTTSPTSSTKPDSKHDAKKPETPERTDLRFGDRGPEVLALQKRLSELGYWLGEPDGHFGGLTQQAVWALQKSAGLGRDGRVGPKTQKALDRGERPSTRLSGNGVDINLSRQILMIVRNGQVRYILNTSTGGGYEYTQEDGDKVTARTPKGSFRVYYSVDGEDKGFLGDMWRPRYFNGGYAVHGSPSIPPYPASHGCARVSNAAMNMIWANNYMPKGGTVLVR